MSNILKHIDLTDRAIRRAVFAVFDGLAAEHRAKCRARDRTSTPGLARVIAWQLGVQNSFLAIHANDFPKALLAMSMP
jgi:hypothetical protein